jgi:hypothetical protein
MERFYRTSDAGPETREAFEDRLPNDGDSRCGNCHAVTDDLTYLPEWLFNACPACIAGCIAADAAEAIDTFLASKIEREQAALFSAREVA